MIKRNGVLESVSNEELFHSDLWDDVSIIGCNAFINCSELKELTVPGSIKKIDDFAFQNCQSLTKLIIGEGVERIDSSVFHHCVNLTDVVLPQSLNSIGSFAFANCKKIKVLKIGSNTVSIGKYCFNGCPFDLEIELNNNSINCDVLNETHYKFAYLSKQFDKLILSNSVYPELRQDYFIINCSSSLDNSYLLNNNYRNNLVQLNQWKSNNEVSFLPLKCVMYSFPASCMKNLYINKNNLRWGRLVYLLQFDSIKDEAKKADAISSLLKIYYAIGGFSDNQGESEKAYYFLINNILSQYKELTIEETAEDLFGNFGGIILSKEHNKNFASLFMKHYANNPQFMVFNGRDYLCDVHNSFSKIEQLYPNRIVNRNERNALLSPEFLAGHCQNIAYSNVLKGNEHLAKTASLYNYSQKEFDIMQIVLEKAKLIKDCSTFPALTITNQNSIIESGVPSKDNILGFFLGDITNCCMHLRGEAKSCLIDGYTNKNAGFLIFYERIFDSNGKKTENKNIICQAYIWYDPTTKTVCYDNIEIPTKVMQRLRSKNGSSNVSTQDLLEAIKVSAYKIYDALNKSGVEVERVTIGENNNDLGKDLHAIYKRECDPIASHRNFYGYSDAEKAQFIIIDNSNRTYAVLM